MSMLHYKHFVKGKRGRAGLKELYSNIFINSKCYSPTQYRLVLWEIANNSSCSGLPDDTHILDNMYKIKMAPAFKRTMFFINT